MGRWAAMPGACLLAFLPALAAVGAPAAADAPAGGVRRALDLQNRRRFVRKTAFSSERAVFVAGLEGSGHHAIAPMLKAVHRARPTEVIPEAVQALLYRRGERPLGVFLMAQDEQRQNLKGVATDREVLKTNFKHIATRDEGRVVLLNSGPWTVDLDTWGIGRMSYPNFGGNGKAMHNPDVRVLAEIAEEAGMDFRVIVLVRTAEEILRSTVYHRHFAPEAVEATVLAGSAALLAAQLQLMDRRFFVCVNSTQLHDEDTWLSTPAADEGGGSLSDLLGVDASDVPKVAGTIADATHQYKVHKEVTNGPDSAPFTARLDPVALEHLAAMNDVLLGVCGF